MKGVYEATSRLCNEGPRKVGMVKSKEGRLLTMTKRDEAKLDTFLHKRLRRLLKIYWPMKVSNEEVRRRARTYTISEQIRRWRWRWIGHVLRMNNQQNPRIALTWAPEGKRSRGRPKVTWRRTVD